MSLLPTHPLGTLLLSALTALMCLPATVVAQGFSAFVSPPRFEVKLTPGKPTRLIVEVQHVGTQPGGYRFYTNDWTLSPEHSVSFTDALVPGSCRPWVAIERRELTLNPGNRYRYRFEITPPANTPLGECRFALMIEGRDAAQMQGPVPQVGGRIGVIVYASVGDASPDLVVTGSRVLLREGKPLAVIDVRNNGLAHGRLDGIVNGTDANGNKIELAPADLPILPNETRSISLNPVAAAGLPAPDPRFPLRVTGQLESGNQRLPLDLQFSTP